jgi:hypothetical protein
MGCQQHYEPSGEKLQRRGHALRQQQDDEALEGGDAELDGLIGPGPGMRRGVGAVVSHLWARFSFAFACLVGLTGGFFNGDASSYR